MMTPADTDRLVALSPPPVRVWVRFQLTTLLQAEPALRSRRPGEVPPDPLDTLRHRTTYLR